ncbi:MAG: ABC transporter substrate-binding protein [Clostridiales bacterium]|jgi:iron complex transport system substrate-binding protein|nr:ABC transporter substrate-binding protein [Clostridiales bacterium]
MLIKRFMAVLFLLIIFSACGGGSARTSDEMLPIKIVSIGASNAEILVALGFGESIVATDMFSSDVVGLSSDVDAVLDMMALDAEYLINLMPDIIFTSSMIRQGGEDDPLSVVSAVGIEVVYVETSESIADIMRDIRLIAAMVGAVEAGESVVAQMEAEIANVRQIVTGISETRTVYFEIEPAPWMISFGEGTFLNEVIEIAGAVNIFAQQNGWFRVSDEALLLANPDVILTSADYLDNPVADIMERPGFAEIAAVQNERVFVINSNASNRPSQNIVTALREIAAAVYPEYFEN